MTISIKGPFKLLPRPVVKRVLLPCLPPKLYIKPQPSIQLAPILKPVDIKYDNKNVKNVKK